MHRISRRSLIAAAAASLALPARGRAQAQPWVPQRPIQIIVGFAPGGASDILARGMAQASQEFVPVPIVVVNRPGAAGVLAAQQVAAAPGDGTQLLVTGGSESTSVPHYREVSYHPLRDFRHVVLAARYPLILCVKGDGPIRSIGDLIERAKAAPGRVTFGSSGVASLYQSVFVVLGKRAGVEMLHVPYTGGAPALTAAAAGQVDVTVATPDECKGLVEAGTLRPIAVASRRRAREYPEVPTLIESGFDVYMENLKGLSVPATTPDPIYEYLAGIFRRGLETPVWQSFAQRAGVTTANIDGAGFTRAIQEMSDAIAAAVKG